MFKKKIKIREWVATTKDRQQGTDSKCIELHGKSIKVLSFIAMSDSPYWRAGFKLCAPNSSDLPLRQNDSFLFHIGSKENESNIKVTVYVNSELKKDASLGYDKKQKVKISFEVNENNFITCYINGQPEFSCKVDSAMFKKIYLVAWGDSQDDKFRQYEVKFQDIAGYCRNFLNKNKQNKNEDEDIWKSNAPKTVGNVIWFWKLVSKYFKNRLVKFLIILFVLFLLIFGYAIFKDKPSFSFTSSGSSYGQEDETKQGFPLMMQFRNEGILRNTFNEKRTLERVDYIFWKNKKLGSTYGGGYVMGKIYDLGKENDGEEIKLPILFEGNESKKIAFSFKVDIQDEEDMKNKFFYICTGVFCHWKTDLELSFKDTRDNMFDENGKLLSQEVEDSWWLFPNNKKFKDKVFAELDIIKDIAIWKIVRYLHLTK